MPSANVAVRRYEPAITPYLSNTDFHASADATQWLLFSDPIDMAAFGLAYLNGRELPTIEQVEQPANVLGMGWRGYHDVGCCQIDHRGAVKSAGA